MAVLMGYQAARVCGQVFKGSARLAGAPRHLAARRFPVGRWQLQRPGRSLAVTAGAAPAVAAVPQTNQGGRLFVASSPLAALAAAAWAFARQSATWLQPALTVQTLGVLCLSAAVSLGLEGTARSLAATGHVLTTLVVQYALMPALGYAAAQLLGLPLALAVCLCVAGGALGSLVARLVYSSPADAVSASRATTAPAAAAAAQRSLEEEASYSTTATAPAVAMASQAACGLDAEAAAARLALAPPSVQAFIQRWGRREGIADAYSAACATDWGAGAILESTDEVPGHHLETAMEAAFRERLEGTAAAVEAAGAASLGVVGVEGTDPAAAAAARLAQAPPQVQSFIQRWGRREGIDAAYAEPRS